MSGFTSEWQIARDVHYTPVADLHTHTHVLAELTDGALADPDGMYRGDVRELLLTVPAEWRQAAVAEQMARECQLWIRVRDGMSETDFRRVGSGQLGVVVGEILAFLAGARVV